MRHAHALILVFLFGTLPGAAHAQWTWVEEDWSGGHFAFADSVEAEAESGELTLASDPERFVPAFRASERAGIWALAARRDTLYLGACDDPMTLDGGEIHAYDLAQDRHWLDYEVFEQGIVVLRAADGRVLSPGVDSMGSHDWGNIYVDEGAGWSRLETVPGAVHVDDLLIHDERIWVTTGQGSPDLRGLLLSSADGGLTWSEEFALEPAPPEAWFRRLYGMTSYGGSLWVQSDFLPPEGPALFELRPDGIVLTHLVAASEYCLAGFATFQGKLLCMTRTLLNIYDGESWSSQSLGLHSSNFAARAVTVHAGRAYVGGVGKIVVSEDLTAWRDAELVDASGREFKDFASYHGRLWAGALHGADVYVTAGAIAGALVSSAHVFPGPVCGGSLDWDAALPAGTGLSLQLRSALHPAGLATAEFVGPDGTANSAYVAPGQSIAAEHCGDLVFQYRIALTSAEPRLTPIVQRVQLDVEPIVTAVDAGAGRLNPPALLWPNPLRPGTRVHLSLSSVEAVCVQIYDTRGRRLRELQLGGRDSFIWDGLDASGRRLPQGSYLIRLRSATGAELGRQGLTLLR